LFLCWRVPDGHGSGGSLHAKDLSTSQQGVDIGPAWHSGKIPIQRVIWIWDSKQKKYPWNWWCTRWATLVVAWAWNVHF
jgi:hypothetical protein